MKGLLSCVCQGLSYEVWLHGDVFRSTQLLAVRYLHAVGCEILARKKSALAKTALLVMALLFTLITSVYRKLLTTCLQGVHYL